MLLLLKFKRGSQADMKPTTSKEGARNRIHVTKADRKEIVIEPMRAHWRIRMS